MNNDQAQNYLAVDWNLCYRGQVIVDSHKILIKMYSFLACL